jgi:hypothetical protein
VRALAAERQLGLLWGGASLATIALARLTPRLGPLVPACPVRAWVGLPCPTCGTTRALMALGHLDFATAVAWNPLVALSIVVLVVGGLVAGLAAAAGRGVPDPPGELPRTLRLAALLVLAANWLYLVQRGV